LDAAMQRRKRGSASREEAREAADA